MTRLSSPIEQMKSHYAVIVIGSGYGGAMPRRDWPVPDSKSACWNEARNFSPANIQTRR
jgi:hypothetical protein